MKVKSSVSPYHFSFSDPQVLYILCITVANQDYFSKVSERTIPYCWSTFKWNIEHFMGMEISTDLPHLVSKAEPEVSFLPQ